ncbi:unnamed protein product [Ectocarpus sp. 13 AM-2016]
MKTDHYTKRQRVRLSSGTQQTTNTATGNQPASRPQHTTVVGRLEACHIATELCSKRTTQTFRKIHVTLLTLSNKTCCVVAQRCDNSYRQQHHLNVRRHHHERSPRTFML